MPLWSPAHKIRRSTRILSFAVRQNYDLLQLAGEECYLLKRFARANATFQLQSRQINTLTRTVTAGSTTVDPDVGHLRALLWSELTDPPSEYPDIGTLTATVVASGSTAVWEPAVDKYSFIDDRNEYTFDIFQDEVDSTGTEIPDAVYMVFNTPPFEALGSAMLTYGPVNPLVNPLSMQPVRDNQPGYQASLFGFEQWLKPNSKIRNRMVPNALLLAFPGVKSDFTITEAGLLRETKADFWTTPAPYSPVIVEHDIIIRKLTGQRFQVVDYTPIYIENILVSQHFNLVELDPRSSIYNITYEV